VKKGGDEVWGEKREKLGTGRRGDEREQDKGKEVVHSNSQWKREK